MKRNSMYVGQITTTALGDPIEIESIGQVFATIYQLDEDLNRIKLLGKDEFLMGRITIKK